VVANGALERRALQFLGAGRYDGDMANETDDPLITRREWLRASAALGIAMVVPGCASVRGTSGRPTASSRRSGMLYEIVIVGGGPGGLPAVLALGRARKRVLLCDAGPRRNAAAEHIHNFVTRDGTQPAAFRQAGREQLTTYLNVETHDVRANRSRECATRSTLA